MENIIYNKGWNLTGFTENKTLNEIRIYFQDKYIEGSLYSYNNTIGYENITDNVEIGTGYWIKLSEEVIVEDSETIYTNEKFIIEDITDYNISQFSIHRNTVFNAIKTCADIFDNIILSFPTSFSQTFNNTNNLCDMTVELLPSSDPIYGQNQLYTRTIKLNVSILQDENGSGTLNDSQVSYIIIVLLHEMLHSFYSISIPNDVLPYFSVLNNENIVYDGVNGVAGYNKILSNVISQEFMLPYAPIENAGDPALGSYGSHWQDVGFGNNNLTLEDGITIFNVNEEVMSGMISTHNYLSPMTIGELKDKGFGINDTSSYISTTYDNIVFDLYTFQFVTTLNPYPIDTILDRTGAAYTIGPFGGIWDDINSDS